MGNHSIVEPATWDDSTPQVPDPGPSSYMDSATTTIENFVTILGKRTRYCKATEEVHYTITTNRIMLLQKELRKQIEVHAAENWLLVQTLPSFVPTFVRGDIFGCTTGGAGGLLYTFVGVNYDTVTYSSSSTPFSGTWYDYKFDSTIGGGYLVAVGSGGAVYTKAPAAATNALTRIHTGGSDLTTIDFHTSNHSFVVGGKSGTLLNSPGNGSSTFTACTHPFGTADIVAVRYVNSLWVATSSDGKLATSSDGLTFTLRLTCGGGAGFCAGQIFYHDALATWAAVGRILSPGTDCFWATSLDGINWTQNTSGFWSTYENQPDFVILGQGIFSGYLNHGVGKRVMNVVQWDFSQVPRLGTSLRPSMLNPTNIVKQLHAMATLENRMYCVATDGTNTYLHVSASARAINVIS